MLVRTRARFAHQWRHGSQAPPPPPRGDFDIDVITNAFKFPAKSPYCDQATMNNLICTANPSFPGGIRIGLGKMDFFSSLVKKLSFVDTVLEWIRSYLSRSYTIHICDKIFIKIIKINIIKQSQFRGSANVINQSKLKLKRTETENEPNNSND